MSTILLSMLLYEMSSNDLSSITIREIAFDVVNAVSISSGRVERKSKRKSSTQ